VGYQSRVQPYKDETVAGGGLSGNSVAYPSTIAPTLDAMECAGLVLDDYNGGTPIQDTSVTVLRTGDDLVLTDITNGALAISVFARNYDFLLASDPDRVTANLTITRSSGLVTTLTWVNNSTSKTIKTVAITRSGGLVSSIVTKVFAANGTTIVAQLTKTLTRTSGLVTSVAISRDV
jgi:hypothetical protein